MEANSGRSGLVPATTTRSKRLAASALGPVIVASNRGPVTYARDPSGETIAERSPGGLVTALLQMPHRLPFTWLSTPVSEEDRSLVGDELHAPGWGRDALRLGFVRMPEGAYRRAYDTIATRLFYFFQHHLFDLALRPRLGQEARAAWRQGYWRYSKAFADRIVAESGESRSPLVMLHDPHMYLVAGLLRQQLPDAVITHFTGIPWPDVRHWQMLPRAMCDDVMRGMLANDIVGFQTSRDRDNFLACVESFGDTARIDWASGRVLHGGRITWARAYPIAIDVEATIAAAESPPAEGIVADLRKTFDGKIIVRVDRTDPSKNIVRGFLAFDTLLSRGSEWAGGLNFLALLPPSRMHLPEYRRYSEHIERDVARINRKHGEGERGPIVLFRKHDYAQGLAMMAVADVVLVNSIADGMNLVAKEAVAVSRNDAVIVLSETVGAARQLNDGALTVGPLDVTGTADALEAALTMPRADRRRRLAAMRKATRAHDLNWWIDTQLRDIDAIGRERGQGAESPI